MNAKNVAVNSEKMLKLTLQKCCASPISKVLCISYNTFRVDRNTSRFSWVRFGSDGPKSRKAVTLSIRMKYCQTKFYYHNADPDHNHNPNHNPTRTKPNCLTGMKLPLILTDYSPAPFYNTITYRLRTFS